MSSSLAVGQPIPAYTQLFDYADDKFPQAVIRNAIGAEIAGSPVDLELLADGLYGNTDLNMPNTAHITVQYFVYSDEEHTTLDESYSGEVDVFTKQDTSGGSSQAVASAITGIIDGEGCRQTGIQDTLVKGSGRALAIRLVQNFPNGEPFDLSEATEIVAKFLNEDRTVLEVKLSDEEIVIDVAVAGKIEVLLTADQSALLMPGSPMPFTMVITLPLGDTALNFPYQLAILDEAVS